MLNLLKKTTPWMVASLFVATSVFAQDGGSCPPKACPPKCAPACPPKPCPKPCPQPCPPTQLCPDQDPCCPAWPTPVLNAAYNYPARIQTRCPWDFDFNAAFIYWQPLQENMELGALKQSALTVGPDRMINMDFNYKPGFKVGAGGYFDHDGWDCQLEYTWFHNNNHTSATQPLNGSIESNWARPGDTDTVATMSEKWRLHMDIGEIDLGRWYYVGTKLTFRPNFGARAAWIRQHVTVVQNQDPIATTNTITGNSTSWAVGAKTGLDTNWMIGSGFRLYGSGMGDLLFTKYTRLSAKTVNTTLAGVSTTVGHVKQSRVYTVKPHLDLELGFGWGTYLDCNNWYMDFAAGYGFQVFFNQNMFRTFVDDINDTHSILPNGNLYIHGLTATFRLEF